VDVAEILARPAVPFTRSSDAASPPPADPPDLSLEEYAALCVDLRGAPAARAEILARHGLTAESAAQVDARWRARCADPATYALFTRACQACEARLAGAALPTLSIEQYASLTVDLDVDPGHRTEILARYRVPEAQLAALDAAWSARFAADASASVSFRRAAATYRKWLARPR
jgi:hypothetical protein